MGDEHNVVEALSSMLVPLAEVVLDPANARRHDDRNVASIAASLSRFGQRTPIVLRAGSMEVEKGNGTVLAARSLGWTHVAAVVVEDDDLTMRAYSISDNRTGETSSWDYRLLSEQIAELEGADWDMGDLGWAESELEVLRAAEWTPPPIDDGDDAGTGSDRAPGPDDGAPATAADGRVPIVLRLRPEDADRVEACRLAVCRAYGVQDLDDALADVLEESVGGAA